LIHRPAHAFRPITLNAMTSDPALEGAVTDQGLVVPREALDKIGAHPGDRVVVSLRPVVRVKPMLGLGKRADATPFTTTYLRELRREIGDGLGNDLTR